MSPSLHSYGCRPCPHIAGGAVFFFCIRSMCLMNFSEFRKFVSISGKKVWNCKVNYSRDNLFTCGKDKRFSKFVQNMIHLWSTYSRRLTTDPNVLCTWLAPYEHVNLMFNTTSTRTLHNKLCIPKRKSVKNLSLFLHQCKFTMPRPRVHSVSQWWSQYLKRDGCTAWSNHSIASF